jgi:protein-S-isoprenylcysteine O-methyltransferase Ste14
MLVMSDGWIFILGLALLFVLGAVIGRRLGPEYRSRLRPSIQTVVAAWAFYWLHFGLVVLAAVKSTWHFSLPTPVALGGGIVLMAVGGGMYLSATYTFGSFKRQMGLDTTRLVTEGIYRWSRNPLFVSWALVLVGLGLVRESAMILLLVLVYWISYRLCLPLEEELLGRLFGEAYETYWHRTHRYFGPPRRAAETPPNKDIQPTAFGGG